MSDGRGAVGRRVGRCVVAVIALALLAGCGGQSEVAVGNVTIHVHNSGTAGGLDSLVTGELQLRDGCVVLEQGQAWYPVVWPVGTRIVSPHPLTIRLASGQQVVAGDEVVGGGGYRQHDTLDVTIRSGCLPPTGEVAVFNGNDDVTVR